MAGSLTEDSCHGQDEQFQKGVLLLIGQPQEAHFSHVGDVKVKYLVTNLAREGTVSTGQGR